MFTVVAVGHTMDLNARKEQFSGAYVRAVAAVAGFGAHVPTPDDDSVDFVIAARGGGGTVRSPRLELQLKCTSQQVLTPGCVRFPLKKKNYDDLRAVDVLVPRILVVVCVPDDDLQWIAHSEQELALRHCGYWVSLRGQPDNGNVASVTVEFPRANQFTPTSLVALMAHVGAGGAP
jgi:hypothetical protein